MKKVESKKTELASIKMIENLRKQHLINVREDKSFPIEEARMYSKTKITQLSKI